MKIQAFAIATDLGQRTFQITNPVEVDPTGDMPPVFLSLVEAFWKEAIQNVAIQNIQPPKFEA